MFFILTFNIIFTNNKKKETVLMLTKKIYDKCLEKLNYVIYTVAGILYAPIYYKRLGTIPK